MRNFPRLILFSLILAVGCSEDLSDASRASESANNSGGNSKSDEPNGDPSGNSETSPDDPDDPEDPEDPFVPPAPVQPLTELPYTTLQKRWAPAPLDDATKQALNRDLEYTAIDRYLEFGVGVVEEDGEPWVEDNRLAPAWDGPTGERRSLTYFWQSADPQVIDEESPIRWEATLVPKGSMYRPQGHLVTQVFDSHVATARRLSDLSSRPFDFAFVAGDLTDGGQQNELGWSLDILAGGLIDPDSGVDDDPLPGEGNDFTDPFYAYGIGVPWYVALGNHETLYMGTFRVNDEIQRYAVGDEVFNFASTLPVVGGISNIFNGYRDARFITAPPVKEGKTPPDAKRRILDLAGVIEGIKNAGGEPAGHGFTQEDVDTGKGYFSFRPVPDRPIRFIVLNTVIDVADVANIQGGLDDEQFEWLENELIQADVEDELVFLGSHHRTGAMSLVAEVGGRQVERLLGQYDNVVAHFVGHDHHSGTFLRRPYDDRRGYWELMCPSSVDFPLQSRIVEVVYEGNRTISIYITNLDHNAAEDSIAHYARHLAAGRKFFWNADYRDDWEQNRQGDNKIVRITIPTDVAANIERHEWSTRIESEETLATLPD